MVPDTKTKNCLTKSLAAIFVLSTVLLCPSAKSDDTFPYLADISSPKLLNPIYLDTSRTEKTIQNTSIPHNLRGNFDEADYFSSSMDEVPPAQPPPVIDFATIPSPSEFGREKEVAKENGKNTRNFIPNDEAAEFFSPSDNSDGEIFAVQEFSKEEKLTNWQHAMQDESSYTASVDSVDLDLSGKKISSIEFQGLNTIKPDDILSQITVQTGSQFNPELIQQDLQKIYAIGYFSDNMSVEPLIKSDDTVELRFILEENILVKNIVITGNNVLSSTELTPFVTQLKGLPQNLNEINLAIDKICNCYHQKGYILANVQTVDDDAEGNLNFIIQEGVINKINISGNERTKDYVIARNIMTQPGTVYNEEYLRKDLAKIFSTQIFDEVNRNITPNEENNDTYDITVVVKEKSTNSVGLGGGIDTGLGAFGSLSLREENFLGKAQKVSLTGIIGSGILLSDASIKNHMNYQAELSFFEPYFLNADNSLMSKLYFREMGSWNIPLAIERRIGFKTGVEHRIKGYDNLSTSFTAGIEHIDLKEGDFNRISQLYAKNHLNIADRAKQLTGGFFINLTPGVKYSNLDDKEVPREGVIAQAQFIEAIGVSDFNHTNGRLAGGITKFFPVFKKSSFSLTGRAGIKVHGDDMPEIMAYRLGGPYSIRGFRMNGVGTGDSFVMGSAELATPLPWVDKLKWDIFKKMRFTFFVDAGKVFDPTTSNILYDRPLHAITAGVGLRMYIPGVGPISVDYGIPITNPGDYGSENGYFTFGTGGLNMYNY